MAKDANEPRTITRLRLGFDKQAPILVTGASAGIGRELSRHLAALGTPVVALGRDVERLAALSRESPLISTIVADLRDPAKMSALAAQLCEKFPNLAGVIHNAAIQKAYRFADSSYDANSIDEEIAINLHAPIALTHALLPHLLRQPQAILVFVSTGLAFAPKAQSAVYSATKAGLGMFCAALGNQLRETQIKTVEVVMPLVDTAMTQGRGRGKMSAQAAALGLLRGLKSGRSRVYVGKARAIPWFMRLAPGLLRRMIGRMD